MGELLYFEIATLESINYCFNYTLVAVWRVFHPRHSLVGCKKVGCKKKSPARKLRMGVSVTFLTLSHHTADRPAFLSRQPRSAQECAGPSSAPWGEDLDLLPHRSGQQERFDHDVIWLHAHRNHG